MNKNHGDTEENRETQRLGYYSSVQYPFCQFFCPLNPFAVHSQVLINLCLSVFLCVSVVSSQL